jgi:hypothetical protein
MTNFYFAANGNKAEVVYQVKHVDCAGSLLKQRIRDLIVDALIADPEFRIPGSEDQYIVSVNGHGGNEVAPLTLNVRIQSRYLPRTDRL